MYNVNVLCLYMYKQIRYVFLWLGCNNYFMIMFAERENWATAWKQRGKFSNFYNSEINEKKKDYLKKLYKINNRKVTLNLIMKFSVLVWRAEYITENGDIESLVYFWEKKNENNNVSLSYVIF
jgi:hypothetical protein